MNKKTIRKIVGRNEFYISLVFIALCLLIQVRSGQFFTPNNIVDLLSAMVVPGIFAIGEFMVIVSVCKEKLVNVLDAVSAADLVLDSFSCVFPNPCEGSTSLVGMRGVGLITASEHEIFAFFQKGTYPGVLPVFPTGPPPFSGENKKGPP